MAEGLLDRPTGKDGKRYPSGAEHRLIEIALLQDEGLHFDDIAAILFFRGHEISVDVLREAYASMFQKMLHVLRRSSSSDDPFDIAEAAGSKLAARASKSSVGHEWRHRLADRDESARSIYQSINIVMLWTVLLGRFPYEGLHREEALRELLDGSGLAAAETDRMGQLGPLTDSIAVDELGDVLGLFNFRTWQEVLEGSKLEDLRRSRESARTLIDFSRSMAEYIRRVGGLPDAMGFGAISSFDDDELSLAMMVPWFLALETTFPDLVDQQPITQLREFTGINEARRMLLDAIPERFWHLLAEGEGAVAKLPPDAADELAQALERFSADHPDELALAMTEVADDEGS